MPIRHKVIILRPSSPVFQGMGFIRKRGARNYLEGDVMQNNRAVLAHHEKSGQGHLPPGRERRKEEEDASWRANAAIKGKEGFLGENEKRRIDRSTFRRLPPAKGINRTMEEENQSITEYSWITRRTTTKPTRKKERIGKTKKKNASLALSWGKGAEEGLETCAGTYRQSAREGNAEPPKHRSIPEMKGGEVADHFIRPAGRKDLLE